MGQAIAYPKHGWLNTKQWSMFVEPVSLDLTNDHTVFLENGGPQNRGFSHFKLTFVLMIWGYPILGTTYSKPQKNRTVKYTGIFQVN